MKKLSLNKVNFAGATALTREELKKVLGGTIPELIDDGGGKDCAFAICSFHGPAGEWVSGYCGSSINGEQCRCIGSGASVPFTGCLP